MKLQKLINLMLRWISFNLFTPVSKEAVKTTPLPVRDRWLEFKEVTLPVKLEWARSLNLTTIAQEANSTPEKVDELAGYPSLWLLLGQIVSASPKLRLRELHTKAAGLLKSEELVGHLRAYLTADSGYGELSVSECAVVVNMIIRGQLSHQFVGVSYLFDRVLPEVQTLEELYALAHEGMQVSYSIYPQHTHDACRSKFFQIVHNEMNRASMDKEALAKLYRSIRQCPPNGCFLCACKEIRQIANRIQSVVVSEVEAAQTVEDLRKIIVPQGICNIRVHTENNYSHAMTELVESKIRRVQKECEQARILKALKR